MDRQTYTQTATKILLWCFLPIEWDHLGSNNSNNLVQFQSSLLMFYIPGNTRHELCNTAFYPELMKDFGNLGKGSEILAWPLNFEILWPNWHF